MGTERSRTASTLINTIMGAFVRVSSLLTGFVLRTVFIRTLGIQYTGVSSLFTDILTVLSLAELGIGSAITYALYRPLAERDERQIASLMRFFKKAYRAVAAAVLAFGLCLIPFLGLIVKDVPDIRESTSLIYILFLINSAASYLLIYKSALFTANQRKYIASGIEILISLLKTAVQCICLYAFRDYILFLAITILATVAQNVAISVRADKEYPFLERRKGKIGGEESRGILRDIRALAMYQVSGVVLNSADSIIISAVINTVSVGLVSNYKLIIASVDAVVRQFFLAIEPSIGNLAVSTDEERQYDTFRATQFVAFWVTCFCSVSFFTLCNPFMDLWLGREYLMSGWIVFALVLNFYMTMMARAVASFRTANGLFVQGQFRPVIMALINVALSVPLAYTNGVFGVLIATAVSRAVTQVWYDARLVYRRVFHKPARRYAALYAGYMAVTAACCAAVAFLCRAIPAGNRYLSFTIDACLCVLVPNIIVVLVYGRTEEYQKIRQVAKGIFSKVREKLAG